MKRLLLITAMTVALSLPGAFKPGQKAEGSDVRVLVSEVIDSRSSKGFFAKCELELILMGNDVVDSMGVRSVRIHYAVDDTGRILTHKKPPGSFHFNEKKDHQVNAKINLKNPARAARFIQSIKGEVELFKPSPKNGSQIVIGRFLDRPGKRISHPTLKKNQVEVSYVTREVYQAQKKREMKNAKGIKQLGQEFGEAFGKMFEGLFAGFMGDEKNAVHLVVNDPENRIVKFDFLDVDGNQVEPMSRSNMGKLRTFGFKELPSPHMQLVLYLATPESIQTAPFTLERVALP